MWGVCVCVLYLEDESLEGLFINPDVESFFITRDMLFKALDAD